jgi:hypothetical protein
LLNLVCQFTHARMLFQQPGEARSMSHWIWRLLRTAARGLHNFGLPVVLCISALACAATPNCLIAFRCLARRAVNKSGESAGC